MSKGVLLVLNLLAITGATVGLTWLYRQRATFGISVSPWILAHGTELVSVIVISSTPIFLFELGRWSVPSTAPTGLIVMLFVFLVVAHGGWRVLAGRPPAAALGSLSSGGAAVVGVLTLGFLGFHGLNVWLSGSPLLQGVHRYAFWMDASVLPGARWIWNQGNVLSLLLGMVFAAGRNQSGAKYRWRVIGPLVGHVLLLGLNALYGDKWSWFIQLVLWFWMPTLLIRGLERQSILTRRAMLVVCFTILIAGGLIYVQYAHYARSVDTSVLRLVGERALALQGQLWWAAYDRANVQHLIAYEHGVQHLLRLGHLVGGGSYGMDWMMAAFGDPLVVQNYARVGVRFTMGFPALPLALGGWIGVVMAAVLAGALFGVAAGYLTRVVLQGRLLASVVAVRAYYLLYLAFTTGDVQNLTKLSAFVYVLLALLLETNILDVGRRALTLVSRTVPAGEAS